MININKILAAFISLALGCCAFQTAEHMGHPLLAAAAAWQTGTAVNSENPFNKQDDREVPYDGSRWVQPVEWNSPTINPRNYKGGIMVFFDKIGLDPDFAPGKTQRVYCSIVGAEEPVSMMKFHIFYDTRLAVKSNPNGEVVNAGKAIREFTTGSAIVEEGQLAFYAYSDTDIPLERGSLFTIDFIVPENAEPGDVYPLGLSYVDDGIVRDTFINSAQDDAGRLQMTYVFTKGIYNGYIKMTGEKKKPAPLRGDTDGNSTVSVEDAQLTLKAYTNRIAGNDMNLTDDQITAADVDGNGTVSVEDAQLILRYYTENTVAGKEITWEDLLPAG